MTPRSRAHGLSFQLRRTAAWLLAIGLGAGLANCAAVPPSPIAHANEAAAAACRAQADREFEAQNRYLLSERSTTDSPLSSSGMVGITSQGLGQQYGRDRDFAACMHGGAGSPLPGPQGVTIE